MLSFLTVNVDVELEMLVVTSTMVDVVGGTFVNGFVGVAVVGLGFVAPTVDPTVDDSGLSVVVVVVVVVLVDSGLVIFVVVPVILVVVVFVVVNNGLGVVVLLLVVALIVVGLAVVVLIVDVFVVVFEVVLGVDVVAGIFCSGLFVVTVVF